MYPGGLEIGEEEREQVLEVLDNKYLFRYYGPEGVFSKVAQLEKEFAQKVQSEVLIENAFHLQKRCPEDIALIGGLANGWTGYMPHADNFAESNQHLLYETVSTMYSEKASTVLLDLIEEVRGC